jgi:uncharacterized protein YaaN involved in tellurite resistance
LELVFFFQGFFMQEVSQNINFSNSDFLLNYGTDVQSKLAAQSERILSEARNKEAGEVGKILNEMMLALEGIRVDKASGGFIARTWSRVLSEISFFKNSYEKISDQLARFIRSLDEAKERLLSENKSLDESYGMNLEHLKELDILIESGEKAIQSESKQSHNVQENLKQEQERSDRIRRIRTFEKKIHDLKMTRMMVIQSLPQIRLIQHNNLELIQKIDASVLNTIPVWKNQITLTLGLEKQKKISGIQKMVAETTNSILRKNSQLLKENSIEIARLNEEGIIEAETLEKVNDDLGLVLAEIVKIYHEGKSKRQEAEKAIKKMENKLRNMLNCIGN